MNASNKTGLRENNRNKRYQSIIKTAERLFANFGLENVKMQVIADEEGVGVATLFRYFPKKDKLIVAVATSIMKEELFQFQRIANEPINAYEKFSKIFNYLAESVTHPSKNSTKFIDAFAGTRGQVPRPTTLDRAKVMYKKKKQPTNFRGSWLFCCF